MSNKDSSSLFLVFLVGLISIMYGCGDALSGDTPRSGGTGPEEDWGGADSDSDTDADTDADADWSGDMDEGDGYPPEKELTADYKVPRGAGRYVFIADEARDSIVIVDSETLEIRVVEVGSRPTHLVPLEGHVDAAVAVINLDSDEVTIIRVGSDASVDTLDLPVRPDTNALAESPDGRYMIAFHDPQFTFESGAPSTDQEITVLTATKGLEGAKHMTVGMHPWKVVYNNAGGAVTRAFVINEEGINIIDLGALDTMGIPSIVSPFEGGTYDPSTADIEITPDGTLALARKTGSDTLVAVELEGEHEKRAYTLPAVPTDLDVAADGSFGLLVLRSTSQVAFFDLPLPEDPEQDPFTYLDLGERVAGVATVSPDGQKIFLHTTTAGEVVDKQRLSLLTRGTDKWEISSVVLERRIRSVTVGVDSNKAIVMHQKKNSSGSEHPYSYSLVEIPSLQVKFQQVPVSPGQLLTTPEGDLGYLLLENASRVDIINLNTFIVDQLKLGSPPTAAGYAAVTEKVFIAQDHPAGRMTFVGVKDGSVKTVTGYNLNDDIEY